MENPEPSRATVAKRARNSANQNLAVRPLVPDFFGSKKKKEFELHEVEGDGTWLEVSDTQVALDVLKRDWEAQMGSALAESFPPVILKSQLYYLVGDKTKVDREVDELKRDGAVGEFFVPSSERSDFFLSTAVDLNDFISQRIKKLSAAKKPNLPFPNVDLKTTISILRFFRDSCLAKHSEPFIAREFLHNAFDDYLSMAHEEEALVVDVDEVAALPAPQSLHVPSKLIQPAKREPKIKYADMEKVLIHEGWLTRRDSSTQFAFALALPNFGRFVKSLSKGRRHFLSLLKRAKFTEKMQSELMEIKKIAGCELSAQYILKDLLGSGKLVKVNLAYGTLIRLGTT